jgi:hypothetical protein
MRALGRISAAAALAVVLSAGASAAVTCGAVTYSLTQTVGTPTAAGCGSGGAGGNDTPSNVNALSPGGFGDWTLGDKSDGGGDQTVTFGSPKPATGQTAWSILNPNGYAQILVTLKQANSFTAWLLDMSGSLSGTWSTVGPGKSTNAISHASVFYRGATTPPLPPPPPIPLPAAGWPMLAGLGGLVAAGRWRATSA